MENTEGTGDIERSQSDVPELLMLGLEGGKDATEESQEVSLSSPLVCHEALVCMNCV